MDIGKVIIAAVLGISLGWSIVKIVETRPKLHNPVVAPLGGWDTFPGPVAEPDDRSGCQRHEIKRCA